MKKPIMKKQTTVKPTAAQPSSAPSGTKAIMSAVSGNIPGRARAVNGLVLLKDALSANYAENATFELPSGTYTVPDITEAIDAYITAASRVGTANVAYHAAVQQERSGRASTLALQAELKAVIAARIGKSATAMATYGFAPAKTPVTSVKAKVAGAVKAEATRVARGTMGAKQKAEITGNVLGVSITPLTAPVTATTTATLAEASAPAPSPVLAPLAKS